MFAILIAAVVLIPRGILIAHYHSSTKDENYHLYRGLISLRRDWASIHSPLTPWNDPPFGEALLAIPAWLNGVHLQNQSYARDTTRDVPPPVKYQYVMPDSIRMETAVWNSLLFLPALAVIFHWVRSVYSIRSAWLILAMLLIEPTLAAHMPLPTIDVLGMDGIIIACWSGWRYLSVPSPSRRLLVAATMSLAMSLKNTALVLPVGLVLLAAIRWVALSPAQRRAIPWHRYLREAILFTLTAAIVLWLCTFCDISSPDLVPSALDSRLLASFARIPVPAGIYLWSVVSGIRHALAGHPAILLGQTSVTGWWYYFPVAAAYKVPLGITFIFMVGIASLAWVRPRYAELPILVCAVVWTLSLMRQHIDIGFRHFLTPEVFWLMLASRCVMVRKPVVTAAVGLAAAAAAIHVATFTPDYLSYINFPRRQVYLQISDSNIDWGQATKELRRWIDGLPNDGRPIYYGGFCPYDEDLFQLVGPRLTKYVPNMGVWVSRTPDASDAGNADLPAHGILVVSPVLVSGQYDPGQRFTRFKKIPPKEIIGHCLLVYDLDELSRPPSY
jgi:hypothetical protein